MNSQMSCTMLDDAKELRVEPLWRDGRQDERVYIRLMAQSTVTMPLDVARELHRQLSAALVVAGHSQIGNAAKMRGLALGYYAEQDGNGLWRINHPEPGVICAFQATEDAAWLEYARVVEKVLSGKQP